jgi:hypothetical protein
VYVRVYSQYYSVYYVRLAQAIRAVGRSGVGDWQRSVLPFRGKKFSP